jgi:hypothetical protein
MADFTFTDLSPAARRSRVKLALLKALAALTVEHDTDQMLYLVACIIADQGYFPPPAHINVVKKKIAPYLYQVAADFPEQCKHDGETFTNRRGVACQRWRWLPLRHDWTSEPQALHTRILKLMDDYPGYREYVEGYDPAKLLEDIRELCANT